MTGAPYIVSIGNERSLLRLCQLVSPAMPIGAYHFSQGLEYAAHANWVNDEHSVSEWIGGLMRHAVATLDVPVLMRMHRAWQAGDSELVRSWSRRLLAARETSELRAEERHLGRALAKILVELDVEAARGWTLSNDATYAAIFALAAQSWDIDALCASQGYLWAWAENQVLAALKLMPFGQSAGQRVLNKIILEIPKIVAHAATLEDDAIGIATPMHGMASSLHESQYSRLFKS